MQLDERTLPHRLKPGTQLLSRPGAHHLHTLLDKKRRLIDLWVTLSQPVHRVKADVITIQSQQETIKTDTRKRQRRKRTGHKMVILVALGFWSDGRREVLDWQMARSEEHQEWEVLLQRLWERDCRPEQGLQRVVRDGSGGLGEALALMYGTTVPEQRCIFHTLQNGATTCRTELKGKENRDLSTQILEQAAVIYQAESASEARTCLARWGAQWRVQAPQAVATLERGFEQTLVFYGISGLAPQWICTTSLLERTNREVRRTFRQVVTFGSQRGAEGAIYLQIRRLHARWTGQNWWETSQTVFFDLWNLSP